MLNRLCPIYELVSVPSKVHPMQGSCGVHIMHGPCKHISATGCHQFSRSSPCILNKGSLSIAKVEKFLLFSFYGKFCRKYNGRFEGERNGLGGFMFSCRCVEGTKPAGTSRERRVMPAVPSQPHTHPRSPSSTRIYVVSDLHTDYAENMLCVKQLSSSIYMQDTVIVAGDVAEKLETFAATMVILKDRFRHVFFVPGNHDLWCRHCEYKHIDSLGKLEILLSTCDSLEVETKPRIVGGVGIIPLFSWYHQSFDKERDITGYRIPPLKMVCMDFRACKWRTPFNNSDDSIAHFFDELNLPNLEQIDEIKKTTKQIITFSHFLPRPDLCPEKRMLFYPHLPKVIGSDLLEAWVRRVHGTEGGVSACHVFGHTHFSWDATVEGIRYIQAPLAYPRERRRRINGGEEWLPFCIYNSDLGCLTDGPLPCYWSNYYRFNPRDPGNNELAPWVRQFYQQRIPQK